MGRLYEFGPFRLDDRDRSLSRDGKRIRLTPKAFDVLRTLAAAGGRLVSKGELFEAVWGDVHVEEAVLTRAVSDLRKALGQTDAQIWIETAPKFGYRLAAEATVSESGGESGELPEKKKAKPRRGWILLLAAAGAVVVLSMSLRPFRTPEPIRTLAILPFQTVGGDSSSRQLGLGMADALINRLSRFDGLVVRPLSTVRPFEQVPVEPMVVGRQLQVEAVLEGTIQFSADSVRSSVRLIRAGNGEALWTESFESGPGRLFAIEDTLAEQVSLRFALHRNELPGPEPNPKAHLFYIKGRYEWGKRTLEGFEKGQDLFRQAIALDPSYARAYAGLADCYLFLGAYGHRPQLEMLPKAKETVLRALELNPRLAEARATLALITQNLDWDWPKVEQEYREAIRLAPGYSTAHHWFAEYLSIRGRFEEARNEFARARRIDPVSPIIQLDEAQLYLFERRYSESIKRLQQVVRSNPSFALAHERMAFTYMIQGRIEDAWSEAMRLPECADSAGECRLTWTAWLPERDPSASRVALKKLEAEASAGRIPLHTVTFGLIRHGQFDRAIDWLERMSDTHAVWVITAKVNPIFDPVRAIPRAKAVLEKIIVS